MNEELTLIFPNDVRLVEVVLNNRQKAFFEIDDYPKDYVYTIQFLDFLKTKNDGFKATVFAVPDWMKEEHYDPLIERKEWLKIGMHGFNHVLGECRLNLEDYKSYKEAERNLAKLTRHYKQMFEKYYDGRMHKYFKAPCYGYNPFMINVLKDLNFIVFVRDVIDLTGIRVFERIMKIRKVDFSIGIQYVALLRKDNIRNMHCHCDNIISPCATSIRKERIYKGYINSIVNYDFIWSEELIQWV